MGKRVSWYYEVVLLREGQAIKRQGTTRAEWPLEALDNIADMAENVWKRYLIKTDLYEYGPGGSLEHVASTRKGQNETQIHQMGKPKNENVIELGPTKDKEKPKPTSWSQTDAWYGTKIGTYVNPEVKFQKFTPKET